MAVYYRTPILIRKNKKVCVDCTNFFYCYIYYILCYNGVKGNVLIEFGSF